MKVEAVGCSNSTTHETNAEKPSILNRLYSMLSPKKSEQLTPLLVPSSTAMTPSLDDRLEELERLFHHFDEDGDGKISPTELQNSCMRSIGEELSLEDVKDFVRSADSDGDGLLGFDDFIELAKTEEGEEERGKNLWEAFRVYEMEGEGCITAKSLRRALDRLGQSKTIEECTTMIQRYDINRDGVICFDEFKIMML